MDRFIEIRNAFPKIKFLTEQEDCLAYATDWTKTRGEAVCVALPKNTEEVSLLLRKCSELKLSVVPQGGRTGLAGGATSTSNELVISLEKMDQIFHFDPLGMTITTEVGITNQALQDYLSSHGLMWPIDLGARGSCHIGGNLSTNAGGLHVIRYGMARRWVLGLKVVLASGEIVSLNHGLEKNNTGYDLMSLFIGSEGTLGVITEATLKLTQIISNKGVYFFTVSSLEKLESLLEVSRREKISLTAFEFFSDLCLKAVQKNSTLTNPLCSFNNYYALIEVDLDETKNANLEKWMEAIFDEKIALEGMQAKTKEEERKIWAIREQITESLQVKAPVRKYDVAVPVKNTVGFLNKLNHHLTSTSYPFDLYLFGHLGDGSPHLNLVRKDGIETIDFLNSCLLFEKSLFPLLKEFSGSASAEHGVGLLKKDWVKFSRTEAELKIFKGIKEVFDPLHILNPGKLIPI